MTNISGMFKIFWKGVLLNTTMVAVSQQLFDGSANLCAAKRRLPTAISIKYIRSKNRWWPKKVLNAFSKHFRSKISVGQRRKRFWACFCANSLKSTVKDKFGRKKSEDQNDLGHSCWIMHVYSISRLWTVQSSLIAFVEVFNSKRIK